MVRENSNVGNDKTNDTYEWIYTSNNTKVFILFPNYANFSVRNINGHIPEGEIMDFNISNSFLRLKSLVKFSEGLYKISSHKGFNSDLLFYVPKRNVGELEDSHFLKPSAFKTTPSSFMLTKKIPDKSIVSSSDSRSSEISSIMFENKTPYANNNETTQNKSASFTNLDLSKTTIETTTSFIDGSTRPFIFKEKSTQTAGDIPDKLEQDTDNENIESDDSDNSDPNKRFNAVVDILHSNEGRKDILIKKSDTQDDPKYTYKYVVNGNYGQEGDGKNPVAIIASLGSAILAVGAIILIFLLKDFLSRRRNIRKTRIRPFISYY